MSDHAASRSTLLIAVSVSPVSGSAREVPEAISSEPLDEKDLGMDGTGGSELTSGLVLDDRWVSRELCLDSLARIDWLSDFRRFVVVLPLDPSWLLALWLGSTAEPLSGSACIAC